MAKEGLTKAGNIQVTPREIDFVTRFTFNWDHLRDILGIMRPIEKQPGQVLKSKKANVVLQDGNIGEGEQIPYSEATVVEQFYKELSLQKFKKAVSIEAIMKHGYDAAVQMTDDEFLAQLQTDVTDDFYNYIQTGTLRITVPTFKKALAKSQGALKNRWKKMHRTMTQIVGFANINDVYDYLGDATVGPEIATQFGLNYIKNWMGFDTILLGSDDEIPKGVVISTPIENIVLYYINAGHADFARAGLPFVVDGETNLIGFRTIGNYDTDVTENNALMGMTLFSEYLDGICVCFISDASMTDATVAAASAESYWGTNVSDLQSSIAVADGKITGTLKYYDDATKALVRDWGEGYFICLKFDSFSSGLTYDDVQVGLMPSEGSGLVTLDVDKDAVIKVTDKDNQILVVVQTNGDVQHIQWFDLSTLTLA